MSVVKEGQFLEQHVTSTLVIAGVYSCQPCKFYTASSSEVRDHIRIKHGGGFARDKENSNALPKSAVNILGCNESISPLFQNMDDSVLKVVEEVQNLERMLSPGDIDIKVLTELQLGGGNARRSRNEVRKREGRLSDALKILLPECKGAAEFLGGARQLKDDVLKSFVSLECEEMSEEREPAIEKGETGVVPLEMSVGTAVCDLISSFQQEEKLAVPIALHRVGGLPQEVSSEVEIAHAPELKNEAAGNPDGQGRHLEEIRPDLTVPQSSAEEPDVKMPPEDIEGRHQGVDGSEEAAASVNEPMALMENAKVFGHVDFQAIAQRASRSNPEATTITVVQHTGGSRPPTTIHFRKSNRSEAIIPTGRSLGIESPFQRKEYAGSKIFACKECHSRYKTQNELERHTTKKHRKQKSYLCEVCGDALATRSGMKIHIARKHADIPIQKCNDCDYVTRSIPRLQLHMKKHTKAVMSEFHCKPCKKSFVSMSKLVQHNNSPMHKNAVDPIICEHCGYVTKKRDNFLVHLRKHTGEKPYRCQHCDYASADASTLKRHVMARHSLIRPFRCSQCEFSCVDKKGLTIHMRKHTGERPFTCDLCPYAAKRMGTLTIHRRTHFKEKPSSSANQEGVLTVQGTKGSSFVSISDIPVTEATFSSVNPSTGHTSQHLTIQHTVPSQPVSMATEVISGDSNPSSSVQIPAQVIVSQTADQAVHSLFESMR